MESHRRSIAKALSWRLIATLVTFLVALIFTKDVVLAAGIGFGDALLKIGAYYSHERLWDRIKFGRRKAKEDYTI